MPKRLAVKDAVTKLVLDGLQANKIRAQYPHISRGYVATIRRRLGLPNLRYSDLSGERVDGRRMGPLSKEWLKTKCRVDANGCWNWTGKTDGGGYGQVRNKGTQSKLHRLGYELWVGPIPAGKHVLHRCDNPPCFNPEHLFLGVQLDNSIDCARKRRNKHKLTIEQVHLIRSSVAPHTVLAKKLGVTAVAICSIRKGRAYKWLEPEQQTK